MLIIVRPLYITAIKLVGKDVSKLAVTAEIVPWASDFVAECVNAKEKPLTENAVYCFCDFQRDAVMTNVGISGRGIPAATVAESLLAGPGIL
jgi:hypothetical protein